ncbi:MAG: hypothetical protein M3N04_05120 [Actinomycetota bacterium]|nr:hypothetical protein [Actinomycetota bacterium]
MPAVRRALAALPVVAVAVAAPSAHAAQIRTFPCVAYIPGQPTMPVAGAGFTPGGSVTLYTNSVAAPEPQILTSARLDDSGGFGLATAAPGFSKPTRNLETFNLVAQDRSDAAAPIVANTAFQLVRFGLRITPTPTRPRSKVTYTARGYVPGRPIYVHFRYRGATRRTVSLGVAKGPCGIAARKMRALPTKLRYGAWRAHVDQERRFSPKTRPQWIDPFTIRRVLR